MMRALPFPHSDAASSVSQGARRLHPSLRSSPFWLRLRHGLAVGPLIRCSAPHPAGFVYVTRWHAFRSCVSLDADAALVFVADLRHSLGVTFTVEVEQETDERWIAEIPQISGAMSYGASRDEAVARVEALGLRVLAERIEQGESSPEIQQVFSVAAA